MAHALIGLFCFLGATYFQPSKLTKAGFYGLGIFYGLPTVLVGFFPCDSDCKTDLIDPSISQLIHNLIGFLTYVFVPSSIILVGLGLKQLPNYNRLSVKAITYGAISIIFVYVLFSSPDSEYISVF